MKCNNIQNKKINSSCILSGKNAPDWTLLTINQPYYESNSNTFRVVVPVGIIPKNNNQIQDIYEEGKDAAVSSLIKNYQKFDNINYRNRIKRKLKGIDIFIPFRQDLGCPDLGTKILYEIPFSDFDQIPFDQNPNLPPSEKEIILDILTLQEKLKDLSNILKNIESSEGASVENLTGINFSKQIRKVETFYGNLQKFATNNDIVLSNKAITLQTSSELIRGDWIILGLDSNNMINYVLLENQEGLFRLRCNVGELNKFFTPTLGAFLSNLEELTQTQNIGQNLFNLVSSVPNLGSGIVNFEAAGNSINLLNSQNLINVELELDKGFGVSFENKSSKTKNNEEKNTEDEKINDDSFLEKIGKNFENDLRTLGDDRFGYLENLNSLEDVFNLLLNRTDFNCFLAAAMECLINNLEGLGVDENDIRKEMTKSYLKTVDVETFFLVLKQLNINPSQLSTLNSNSKDLFIKCFNSLNEKNKTDLKNGFELRAKKVFSNIEEINQYELENIIDGFGFRSKNVLVNAYTQNKSEIIDELLEVVQPDTLANLNNSSFTGLSLVNSGYDALRKLDLCDLEFSLNFPLPFINFSFNWDDLFPTWDELEAFIQGLISSILSALTSAILDFIKSLLSLTLSVCEGDGVSAGIPGIVNGFSDGSLLKQALADGLGVTLPQLEKADLGKLILDRLNINPQFNLTENFDQFASNLNSFLNDLGAVLTPNELIQFLNGETTDDVRELLNCLVKSKYSALQNKDLNQIGKGLGGLANKNNLLLQAQVFVEETQEKCDPAFEGIRNNILRSKGLDQELIEKQLMNARARKLQQLAKLAEQIEDPNFQDIIPNVFCGPNGNGLTSQNPRSVQFMMDRTINTIFDGIRTAFNNDINSFPDSISEVFNKPERIKKFRQIEKDGRTITYINPEWQKLTAEGFPDEIRNEDGSINEGETDDLKRETVIYKPTAKNIVGQSINNVYKNIDNIFQTNDVGYNISIPTPSEDVVQFSVQALQNINLNQIKDVAGDFIDFSTVSQEDFSNLLNSQTQETLTPKKFGIEYNFKGSCQAREIYDFGFFYKNSLSPEKVYIHRFTENKEVPSFVTNAISNNNLRNDIATESPQESYFKDLIYKNLMNKGQFLNKENVLSAVTESFTKTNFYNLFENLLKIFSARVADSALFNKKVIQTIDWTPPTIPGCDPSLLSLDDVKKNIKKAVMNNECSTDDFPNTNPYSPKLSTMEQQSVFELLLMLYRLYIIDFILKSIFVFSEFGSISDDLIISFIREEFKRDVKELKENYYNDIVKDTLAFYKQETENTDNDINKAIDLLISLNLDDVRCKILTMIDAFYDGNVNRLFIDSMLPLFGVWESSKDVRNLNDNLRFYDSVTRSNTTQEVKLNNLKNSKNLKQNNFVIQSLENGGFLLEKYARVFYTDLYKQNNSLPDDIRDGGVVGFNRLGVFLRANRSLNTSDIFKEIKIGLRAVYSMPLKEFEIFFSNRDSSPLGLIANFEPDKTKLLEEKEKAYFGIEGYRDGSNFKVRTFNTIPLAFEEIDIPLVNDNTGAPGDVFESLFIQNNNILAEELSNSEMFKFVFNYLISIERAISILSMVSYGHLSTKQEVDILFDPTKSNFKRTYYSLKNAGVSDYQDPIVKAGVGALTEQKPSFNTENPDILGIIIKFLVTTPIRILKGLVEVADPNIRIAKLISDSSRLLCKPIPIEVASLGLLPINVFGPFIGIGPPISPLGFVYLGMSAYNSVNIPGCSDEENEAAKQLGKNILRGEDLSRKICERLKGKQ